MSTVKLPNALQDIPESASTSWNIRNASLENTVDFKKWNIRERTRSFKAGNTTYERSNSYEREPIVNDPNWSRGESCDNPKGRTCKQVLGEGSWRF